MRAVPALLLAALLPLPALSQGTAPTGPAAAVAAEVPAPAAPPRLILPGREPQALTAERLAALPQEAVDVDYQTSKGERREHYRGPRLWSVLEAARVGKEDHKAALGQTVILTASDGYRAAFALGELMHDFGGRPVLLSSELDGQPTPDGLRSVAAGDKRGGRYVKGIATIEVR